MIFSCDVSRCLIGKVLGSGEKVDESYRVSEIELHVSPCQSVYMYLNATYNCIIYVYKDNIVWIHNVVINHKNIMTFDKTNKYTH